MTQAPLESKAELIATLEAGCKPRSSWRIGTENELFFYDKQGSQAVPYSGDRGIHAVLMEFVKLGWQPIYENENIIALEKNNASITLEPAGQFELSGAPLTSLRDSCLELKNHQENVDRIAAQLDLGCLRLGFHPTHTRESVPVMPKGRYKIMREYMPKVGTLGLDMMFRTGSHQVNLDFSSEADMIKKFRVSMALQPFMTAMVANSPFLEGKPSGFKSYRHHVWTQTDPARTGILPFVYQDNFCFERYVDYVLDVPMYFVHRENYIDASGMSFRDFMNGKLPAYPNQKPTHDDWNDHLTTIFTEVRLKTYLEMRGADNVKWPLSSAITAFWVGILYSQTALDAAWDEIKNWDINSLVQLHQIVGRDALKTSWQNKTVADAVKLFLTIAHAGLTELNENAELYLQSLQEIVDSGETPADKLLQLYQGPWGNNIKPIFA